MINMPSLPLKIVFLVHLVLTTCQGFWLPNSYIYYNAFFMLALLWAIYNKESDEPVFLALALDLAAIIIDIIVLSFHNDVSYMNYTQKDFTLVVGIMNILCRPVSAIILYRVMNERITGISTDFGIPGFSTILAGNAQPAARGPYEDIDRPVTQSMPHNNYEPFNSRPKGSNFSDAHLPMPD